MTKIRKMQTAAGGPLRATPQMTTENVKHVANRLGEYFLKGMGAVGRFLNAGFTSPTYGTNGQVSYARNAKDAKRLRLQYEASEQALAKGSTYIMPANYIAGKGNPVKGEEKISLMEPWLLAAIRGAELYFTPKVVKGIKNAPKTVVNTAAKAGNKTAKKVVVAREIKLNIKNTLPKLSNRTISIDRNVNPITKKPDLIYTLYNEFGEPIGQTNVGSATMGLVKREGSRNLDRMIDGIYSKNKAHKVSEDTYNVAVLDVIDNGGTGIESGWSLMSPLKTLSVTSKFPNVVIGLEFGNPVKLLTGRSSRPMPLKVSGNHYLEIKPKTEIQFNEATGNFEEIPIKETIQEPSTSLKFFERKPSKISLAERLGISKGDRGNLNKFLTDALEDLNLYINSGLYRLLPTINMETAEPSWVSRNGNVSALRLLVEDGVRSSGRNSWAWNRPNGGTYELTTTSNGDGTFGIGYNSYRMFDIAPEFNSRVGEASASSAKHGYSKIYLTAPKNDAFHFITENPIQEATRKVLIETLSPRISKDIMRDFWSGVLLSLKPGAYLSGDEGMLPKGSDLIRLFKELSKKAYRKDNNGNIIGSGRTNWEDIRNNLMKPTIWKSHSDGLSTDSYLALLKQTNRENSPYSLRYSPDGFETFNSLSIDNKFISDLLEKAKTGEIPLLEFLDVFHKWVEPYKGMDAKIVNGKIIIPHPFLYKKKQGGKMNIIDFLKKGSGIHIKKENRGKFTDYCGGKVTSKCIARGKASSNPAIRKRATFAANARKWKHLEGGTIIKALTGLKTAPLVKDRYKNGVNYSYKIDASPYGYSITSGTMTDNPLMFQGNIAREITYLSDGTPTDTIYWETPPTLLPVRTKTRGAGRKAYFDKPYMGDSILYKVLLRRYNEARKLNSRKNGGILKGLEGLKTDIDRRRDTTGKGVGNMPFFGAANFGSSDSPLALFYGSKEGGPQPRDPFGPQTGAPEILPGRINKGVKIIEKEAPNLFELINKFPSVAKDIVTKNIRKWKEFFRTGDKNILKSFESNAESILNARNTNVTYGRGFIKGSEVTPKSGTLPLSETGLSVRETRLGNMKNPPTNPAEKLAVLDWNKMNPENLINALLPTGRPSYELKLEGFDPIDIRYPKQALPLLKKLNSVLKIELRAPKRTAKERYQENKEIPSKNLLLKGKYNETYEDGDLRHTYSGNPRMKRLQKENDWELLDNYYPFLKEKLKLLRRRAKLEASGKFQGLIKKQWMKDQDALIERFRNTYRFKKGGKAFHTGINVLDSNPKMSKAASRKVKKAEEGTKLNTFLKIGNFLNSDTGKVIGSTLMNGISTGFQAKQMNDAIKLYELASKSKLEKIMNGILADDSNYLEALLLMLLTKGENENISDTVVRAKAYDIAKLKALKKLNDYKDEMNLNIVNMKQYANEQTINNFSGIFNLGMSGVMSLLNKKLDTKVDNGAPSLLWTLSEGWLNYLKASGYNV